MVNKQLSLIDRSKIENTFLQSLGYEASSKVLFISSYVPRKCGIATFCRDLVSGVKVFDKNLGIEVAAMVDSLSEKLVYPKEVKFLVRQKEWKDYEELIYYINSSRDIGLVVIEHEFGIYGGISGEYVVRLMSKIKKPMFTTLHTVLPKPSENKKKIIKNVCSLSEKVVVMLSKGAEILESVYKIEKSKIVIVPHGVPDFKNIDIDSAKKKLNLENKTVMSSINLLSPYKGIEYAIKSLPAIVKENPNFVYQIIGETHPVYIKLKGGKDIYRQKLKRLVKRLKLEKNVRFINEYVSVDDLVGYVNASDFYVTPYLDPQQATSGALAYAIGAGKVCISASYLYAKEMLSRSAGVLVPFKDPEAISKAVNTLIKDPQQRKKIEKNVKEVGKEMSWESVGKKYAVLISGILGERRIFYPLSKNSFFN